MRVIRTFAATAATLSVLAVVLSIRPHALVLSRAPIRQAEAFVGNRAESPAWEELSDEIPEATLADSAAALEDQRDAAEVVPNLAASQYASGIQLAAFETPAGDSPYVGRLPELSESGALIVDAEPRPERPLLPQPRAEYLDSIGGEGSEDEPVPCIRRFAQRGPADRRARWRIRLRTPAPGRAPRGPGSQERLPASAKPIRSTAPPRRRWPKAAPPSAPRRGSGCE